MFLDLFTVLLFLQISVVTSINHYNPSLYLELSLKGRRLTVLFLQALAVALLLGAVELFSGSGGLCASKEVEQKILGFAFPLLILNLLLQQGVVVDTCWGWARLRNRAVNEHSQVSQCPEKVSQFYLYLPCLNACIAIMSY